MKTSLFAPQNAEQSAETYKRQALQNIAGLVNSNADPTGLAEPLRDEITDWFLLETKTAPQDAQLAFIIRSLIAESLKSGGIKPSRVREKLKSTVWSAERHGSLYDGKTGKRSAGFREVMVDMSENPNLFGIVDFDEEYTNEGADSGIPKQASDFIARLYKKLNGTDINGRFLDSVIGSMNARDTFLYIISDTEDGKVPQDISAEAMMGALEEALNAKMKADPTSRKTACAIWGMAASLPGEMASEPETTLSKETILERLEYANAMQEQNLDGEEFSICDLKNIVPLRAEGDCEKTAHENTNALMAGLKRLPGLGETVSENIAGNGLRRTLNNDFLAKIAEFDNAPIDGGEFKKAVAAYEATRFLCKGVYSLWALAVFGMKPAGKPVWANRARKVMEAVKAIDGRNLIEYAAGISNPCLVKAGAPRIDAGKLRMIYAKIKSVAAEAEPICLQAEKAYLPIANKAVGKSQGKAIRKVVGECENEIKNIWSFGMKPSFDTDIE